LSTELAISHCCQGPPEGPAVPPTEAETLAATAAQHQYPCLLDCILKFLTLLGIYHQPHLTLQHRLLSNDRHLPTLTRHSYQLPGVAGVFPGVAGVVPGVAGACCGFVTVAPPFAEFVFLVPVLNGKVMVTPKPDFHSC
jgi:hypothetical protein